MGIKGLAEGHRLQGSVSGEGAVHGDTPGDGDTGNGNTGDGESHVRTGILRMRNLIRVWASQGWEIPQEDRNAKDKGIPCEDPEDLPNTPPPLHPTP